MSRYAEPQPPTVSPGELDMANSDTFESTPNESWFHPTLLGEHPAHRFHALSARGRRSQNFVDHSSVNSFGANDTSHDLNALATPSGYHPPIEATRTVSSRGHGRASDIPSSLAFTDGPMVYNSNELLRRLNNPSFTTTFNNASIKKRKEIIERLKAENLNGEDMEHDEECSESSYGSQRRQEKYPCPEPGCHKSFPKKATLT